MEKRLISDNQIERILSKEGRILAFLFRNKIPFMIEIVKSNSNYKYACFSNNLPTRTHNSITTLDSASPLFKDCFSRNGQFFYFNNLKELRYISSCNYGIIVPNDFYEKYNAFLNTNKKSVLQVISKYCGSTSQDVTKYLFTLTDSPNYFVWALKLVLSQGISTAVIRTIMVWVKNHQDLVKLLSKHTITAYTNSMSLCELSNEFMRVRALKRANTTINEFNTCQKKMFKAEIAANNLSALQLKTLDEFSKLSDVKRKNFIRKISNIENIDEIFKLMEILVSTRFEWNAASVKEFIEVGDINANVIYEGGNILVCEILDFAAIKKIAKTTNWCIAKNRRYWSQYINDGAKQYVIFNFNEKEDSEMSIVGFTSSPMFYGITNAHSFTNANLIQSGELSAERRFQHTPIIPKKQVMGIYSFLNKCEIPLNRIFNFQPTINPWEKNHAIELLKKYINPFDYDIIQNKGDKLVVKVDWEAIDSRSFDKVVRVNRNLLTIYTTPKYALVFFDFAKSADVLEKIYIAVIEENNTTKIENCSNVVTEFLPTKKSFDDLLAEYDLPMTVIKRINTPSSRLIDFLIFGEFDNFFKELKKDGGIEELRHLINDNPTFKENLITSIFNCIDYFSFDFVKAIYECGETIGGLFGKTVLGTMANRLTYTVISSSTNQVINLEKQFPLVINGTIKNSSLAHSIAAFYMFTTAFNNEIDKKTFSEIVLDILYKENIHAVTATMIVNSIISAFDLTKLNKTTHKLFTVICNYDCRLAIEKILKCNLDKNVINFISSRLHYDSPMLPFVLARKKEIVGA